MLLVVVQLVVVPSALTHDTQTSVTVSVEHELLLLLVDELVVVVVPPLSSAGPMPGG